MSAARTRARREKQIEERNARVAAAQALERIGKSHREIGELLGLHYTTITAYLNYPESSTRPKASKPLCSNNCGRTASGKTGLCQECWVQERRDNRKWTPEMIRDGWDRWIAEHGVRPTSGQWLAATGGRYPSVSAVQREFGSWSAMVEAFGGAPIPRTSKVTLDELIAELQEQSKPHGVAPSTQTPNPLQKAFYRKGLTWKQACDMAGVKSRSSLRNWE